MFKKELIKVATTEISVPSAMPREKCPVKTMFCKIEETKSKAPIASTGEKSSAPMRTNLKRLNQLRYGSQISDKILPTFEYASDGIHVKITRTKIKTVKSEINPAIKRHKKRTTCTIKLQLKKITRAKRILRKAYLQARL